MESSSSGIIGFGYSGDLSGGDVEPERGAECAIVNDHHGFSEAVAAGFRGGAVAALGALGHGGLGGDYVHGGFERAALGQRTRAGLAIASVLYGALLGVFLLGVLTKRPGEWSAIIGMSVGFIVTLVLRTRVAYTWYVLIGSLATFTAGYLASYILPRRIDRKLDLKVSQ